jgi:hypothetical protein
MNKLIEIIASYLGSVTTHTNSLDRIKFERACTNGAKEFITEEATALAEKLTSSGLVFKGPIERMAAQFDDTQKRILDDANKSQFSDGYHTFENLYEHRYALFVALINSNRTHAWRALANADGEKWEGWFIAGLFPEEGKQISYHLPMRFWEALDGVPWFEVNPYFDGHTSEDVINRLKSL